MEGEKIEIFGKKYVHYPKKFTTPYFQPRLHDLKGLNRRFWYNIILIINTFYAVIKIIKGQ